MGFFGKLFDKKECAVCGGEIGLLGNRKLEDGNLCKNCAKQLSPWFSERRHSTVEDIKQQLAYREENKAKVAQFSTSRSMGENWRVLLDDSHRWLVVTKSRNLAEVNPDVVDYSAVTGCRMDIDETRTELTRKDNNGNEVSYRPPRYRYSYDFKIIITVNNPYFDEMSFSLNPTRVAVQQDVPLTTGRPSFLGGSSTFGGSYDPMNHPEYRQYYEMCQQICDEIRQIQTMNRESAQAAPAAAAPQAAPAAAAAPAAGPWTCPACGSPNNGKFCEACGSPRPQ